MIRTGIIGCGSISRVHGESIKQLSNVILCGTADSHPERAREFAHQYGTSDTGAYASLDEMLADQTLDVLHICTPHHCHVPMAVQTLSHGIHVFMEKPPAISREQYQLLKETADQNHARIGICFQNRYNETTHTIDRLLKDPQVGAVLGARAFVTWNRPMEYYTESEWRGSLSTEGGGVLINQSVHTLDLLLRWLGTPTTVEASMANHHLKAIIEVEDTLEAYLAFDQGTRCPTASFYATTAYAADAPVMIELACEHALLRLEETQVQCRFHDGHTVIYDHQGSVNSPKAYWGNGHLACITDYYHCLEQNLPFSNDLDSVDNTFETMMSIYESARQSERSF